MEKQRKPKALKDKRREYKYTMSGKAKTTEKAEHIAREMGIKIVYQIQDRPQLFNNQYCVSQMISERQNRQYYFHHDIKIIKSFIKKLPNHHLCEVINTNYPKVYFDMDKLNNNEGYTDELYNEIVMVLTDKFNAEFGTDVPDCSVIKLVKRNDEDKIVSTHIIFPYQAIDKKILKWWVQKINEKSKIKIDDSVYGRNQNFGLRDNCKFGKEVVFEEYDDENTHLGQTLCMTGYDKDCITEHKPYTDELKTKAVNDEIVSTLTKRDKNIIKVNGSNLVEELLKNIPQDHKFYRSKFWGGLVATMKHIGVKEIEVFLKVSVERAMKPHHHTKADNIEWFNNLTECEYKNMSGQMKKLNRDYGLRFVWVGNSFYDTEELREWVHKNTGLCRDMIDMKFNKIHKKCYDKPTKISFGGKCFLDLSKMFLINGEENIKCYWKDYHQENLVKKTETPFEVLDLQIPRPLNKHEQDRTDLLEKNLQFIKDDNKVFGLKMAWGMGKSHYIMKPFVWGRFKRNDKILILTENNALNKDVYEDLKEIFEENDEDSELLFWGHQEHQPITEDHRIFICSEESLHKLTKKKPVPIEFNTVILDEYETIISHLESTTFKNYYDCGEFIKDLCGVVSNADKVMVLDADLSPSRFNILTKNMKIKNDKIKLYENTENKWRDYKFLVNAGNRYGTISKIMDCIENDENIAVASMSKTTAEQLFQLLKKRYPTKNILGVWRGVKKYKLNNEEERKLTKEEAKSSMNNIIDNKKINIWIYSPTILTGISYNKEEWFNRTFLLSSPTSCCARLAIQMLFRVRHLKNREINLCLSTLKPPKEEHTNDEIRELIKQKKMVSKASAVELLFENNPIIQELWKDFKVENLKELYLSKTILGGDLGQEILRILTANHKIPLQFINISKTQYDNMITKEDMAETKEEVKQNNIDRFVRAEYKDKKTIDRQEKKNYTDSFDYKSIEEVEKKKLLKKLGLRNTYYKRYGERVDEMVMEGTESEAVGNNHIYFDWDTCDGKTMIRITPFKQRGTIGKVKTKPITYENFIHDEREIYEGLLDLDKTSHIDNINDYNKVTDEAITDTEEVLDERDEINIYNNNLRFVIKKLFPELFEGDILKHKSFNIKVKDFNERLDSNKEQINKYWGMLMNLDKVKKKSSITTKNTDKIIYYIKRLLNRIGLDIEAPNNKKRDNAEYKIIYDKVFIYTDTNPKPRTQDIRIDSNHLTMNGKTIPILDKRDKPVKELVSKNNTIKSSIKKQLNYNEKDKLTHHNIIIWNDGNKTDKTIYKTPSIKAVKINTADTAPHREILKDQSLFKREFTKHFIRMRPLKVDDDLYKEYHKSLTEQSRCLIEDEEDRELDLIVLCEEPSPLDAGVESD